jgi:4-hydroxythreonine-4-phosphate dehydrogenase
MEAYITTAVDLAVSGKIAAMVTAPINKEALKMGGSRYTGHTELIAERVGCERYAMMLAGDRLRVVLVTIHMALTKVPAALTPEKIQTVLEITAESLRSRFGIPVPSIAVAGLNPHAGEGGLFGDEEERLIAPAVAKARQTTGATITGPLPPDTVFVAAAAGRYDAVVCMYHDQGLIPLKLLHFEDGVNTTLGLPIIRTSVDHGTAYDIAGTGRAGCASLEAAVRMAVQQSLQAGNGTKTT